VSNPQTGESVNTLPTLYKKTSTGDDQQWTVAVDSNAIISRWGRVGGAIQETRDVIKEGKNLGKKNATTPAEQAALEAQALWEKKLKRGYVKSIGDARKGKVDGVIEGGWWPMLAKSFGDEGHKIVFPAYGQPKLNGHRISAEVEDGKASLWSRKRNLITGVPHVNRALEKLLPKKGKFRLDGEGYHHDFHDHLEKISHFLRSETPEEGHEIMQYHVYDMNHPGSFADRLLLRDKLFKGEEVVGPLHRVKTVLIKDEEEMLALCDHFLDEKYEGLMVRNAMGEYKDVSASSRSDDLQKVKRFTDAEFKIIGVTDGRGKDAGCAIFVCVTSEGAEFKAKMKGGYAKLREYFENAEKYIGRNLTVKYANLTKKSKVPFHPVAWRIHEDL
jgi:ATP-dependent DNA ligase/predicted DNA-binding WGR domain protein